MLLASGLRYPVINSGLYLLMFLVEELYGMQLAPLAGG